MVLGFIPEDIEAFLKQVEAGEIPTIAPQSCYQRIPYLSFSSSDGHFRARDVCVEGGMWAIVDLTWTKQLAEWIGKRTVLEIMAGKGWLAEALKAHGIDIIATDSREWDDRHQACKLESSVIELDAVEAVKHYSVRDILLVSWSPYEDDTIDRACEHWKKPIIYIGEGAEGCNASDSFFDRFEIDDTVLRIDLPVWYGLHDQIIIGCYR